MDLTDSGVDRRPGVRTARARPQSLRSSSTSNGAKDMDAYLGKQQSLGYEVNICCDRNGLIRNYFSSAMCDRLRILIPAVTPVAM